MSILRSATAGLRTLFRKDVVERELDDELRHYLALATQENIRKGMPPDAAERAARIGMGGLEANKNDVRAGGWEAGIESLRQDVRVAWRGLIRSPGFTLIALASLALGIGVNTTMFTVVNAVMFRPLPYRDADRLAFIWTNDARRSLPREGTAYLTVRDWQTRNRSFTDIAYFSLGRLTLVANDEARSRGRARSAHVSANIFSVLGVVPLQGRLLSEADERERAPVAVISYAFWQRWFGGTPDVIGKTITIDGSPSVKDGPPGLTVVGVLPNGFFFSGHYTEVFTPATTYWRFDRESSMRYEAWARRWTGIGRLADGVTIEEARRDLANVGRQLEVTYPTTYEDFPGFGTAVVPMRETVAGANLQSALWVLLGAVGLVLLVVCANVANLQLARGSTRQREFAVRRALGAGRGRIVRQLIVESLVLVIAGGAIGIALTAWGTPLLSTFASNYLPLMNQVTLDWRVLSFAAAAAVVSGLVFGLLPALRLSSTDANEAMREGGHGTGSVRLRRSQGMLVLAECALALVLLTGAGLLLKSLNKLQSVAPGFDPQRVLTMRLEFPGETPASIAHGSGPAQQGRARAWHQWAKNLTGRLESIPGVESVGFIDDLFIGGVGNESITIPGKSASEIPAGELAEGFVTPGFFSALRVPLTRGRPPAAEDAEQKIRALFTPPQNGLSLAEKERLAVPEPVIVNEAFVRRFFPGEDPVGRRFCIDPTHKTYWYEIVGVVGDMRRKGLEQSVIPEYYGQYFPLPNGRSDLVVRTTGDPLALAATIRSEVQRAMPSILVVTVSTVDEQLGGFTAQRRLQTWLLTLFAALALVLAAIGIFGLAHYSVAERTREIGVRVALGASPGDVIRLVIVQGMRMPAIGIAVGLVASLGLTRVISNQLFDVQATDPLTYAGVAAVLASVAAAACYLAARRAARSDPVKALREA